MQQGLTGNKLSHMDIFVNVRLGYVLHLFFFFLLLDHLRMSKSSPNILSSVRCRSHTHTHVVCFDQIEHNKELSLRKSSNNYCVELLMVAIVTSGCYLRRKTFHIQQNTPAIVPFFSKDSCPQENQ